MRRKNSTIQSTVCVVIRSFKISEPGCRSVLFGISMNIPCKSTAWYYSFCFQNRYIQTFVLYKYMWYVIEWASRVLSLSFNRCIYVLVEKLKLRTNTCTCIIHVYVVWYKRKQCIFMNLSQLTFKENEIDSSHGLNLYYLYF